jgi:hypothetical protein
LLERLRAQRESMQAAASGAATAPPMPDLSPPEPESMAPMPPMPVPMAAPPVHVAEPEPARLAPEYLQRLERLESDREDSRKRVDSVEASLRAGLADLRAELPGMMTAEISKHTTATNEAVAEIGGRLGRVETEFTRERERWANVVTSFDQRLDQRLRSFRQDVTVMLTGMAVLILAMLMLLLLRR